jgi:serine/threonine protein phosphatase PrpC
MRRILGVLPPDEAANELINLANDRGGLDNISVQIIRVNPSEGRLKRLFKRKSKR